MQDDRFRLVRRGRMYCAVDKTTGVRESLKTDDRKVAEKLLRAKNDAVQMPFMNVAIAKVHLAAKDPRLVTRTWGDVMDDYGTRGKESTQVRVKRAFANASFRKLRSLKLVETCDSHFEEIIKTKKSSSVNYLRRLHNRARKRGWLLEDILPPSDWPATTEGSQRGITLEEHQAILASEQNPERKLYYSMVWEVGGAQSDVVNLSRDNVDQKKNVLVYHRQKTKEKCQLAIGQGLAELLAQLPAEGYFFPTWRLVEPKDRSTEFTRRCKVSKVTGVTLHCYRYGWAERAAEAGYPERFAQAALGHKSKAVARAYSRKADVVCPPLESFSPNVIPFRTAQPNTTGDAAASA